MAQTIKIRRALAAGSAPASLLVGEIALSEFDGKLFTRTSAGAIRSTDLNADALKTTLTAQVVASATAADTNILTLSIPASQLRVGSQFSTDIYGNADNALNGGTINVWLKIGTTKIATLSVVTATTAQTVKGWSARFIFTVRSIGATGTVIAAASGSFSSATAIAAELPMSIATVATTTDTTSAQTLTLGMNWTAAVSGNIVRCDHANIALVKL